MIRSGLLVFLLAGMLVGCKDTDKNPLVKGTYAYDADFLKQNTRHVVELAGANGHGKVLLSADYQGRVMTSTASGDGGASFGWINYSLIASGEMKKQFNPVGGEERFWLGPEGGQYSVYFAPGDSFAIDNWQVPAVIDTVTYDIKSHTETEAIFSKDAIIRNYSGEDFKLAIERKVSLLTQEQIAGKLGVKVPAGIQSVGYETTNQITNKGENDWTRERGLLSIWLLGMMTPTENTIVIVPFHPAPNAIDLITTSYFGEIPPERLQIKDSVLYFTCDGKFRSKIGLSPAIAKPLAASFDFKKNVLTVIQFPVERDSAYVNSKWEIQKEPYRGDVVNSYNDGPLTGGSQLGPFYELESSSKALALKKGEQGTYRQSTFHFEGNIESLNNLAVQILGVDLNEVKK